MKQHVLDNSLNPQAKTIIFYLILACFVISMIGCSKVDTEGWNTYRHDSQRSGSTISPVTPPLFLRWVHKPTHPPKSAWMEPAEELPRMHFDNAHHVCVASGLAFFGSTVDNKVYALDVATGKVSWSFFTAGPIRYAPTLWKGRVYVGSDDGYVYCLKAGSGKPVWKYRAGPSAEKVLGNGRMISLWPVRTSVIVDAGIVYFGAGVFPYEGLYICALDADDGKIIWKNDTIGDLTHEHQFGGITPQGYLIASENILYVPSGRNMPAAFDKASGRFLFSLEPGSKVGGTWALLDDDDLIAGVDRSGTPAKVVYDSETGERKGDAFAAFNGIDLALTPETAYTLTDDGIYALNRAAFPDITQNINDIKADIRKLQGKIQVQRYYIMLGRSNDHKKLENLIEENSPKIGKLTAQKDSLKNSLARWAYPAENFHALIRVNNVVFAGGENAVIGIDTQSGKQLWKSEVEGTIYGLAASKGQLFASADNGAIYCFSEEKISEEAPVTIAPKAETYPEDDLSAIYKNAAATILNETGVDKGYCLVLNCGSGQLAFELANRSDLKIIGIDSNPKNIEIAKKRLSAAGLYGSKIVVESWDISSLPDYFANLIVSDDMLFSGSIDSGFGDIFRLLKPCGGVAFFGQPDAETGISKKIEANRLVDWLKIAAAPAPEKISKNGTWAKLTRGSLPGAGSWANQYANPQNTACSDDKLIKGPLGVLWYGEPGPNRMIERHGKPASPVAMDGRLFVQGGNIIMAYDSYNGTLLWEREIPGAARARADVDGSNLALTSAGLFAAIGDKCLRLDPATGNTLRTYKIPASPDNSPRRWGYIACIGNTLFGSAAIPLNQGYDRFWQNLANDDGTWKDKSELAPVDALGYEQYVESFYPKADNNARCHFQRDGAGWRYMANYPAFDGGNFGMQPADEKLMCGDAVFAINTETGKLKWVHRGRRIANISISIGDGLVFFADDALNRSQKASALGETRRLIQRGICEKSEFEVKPENIDVRMAIALDAVTGQKRWEKPIDLTGCGGNALATAYQDDVLLFFGSFGLHDKWRFPNGELTWHRVTALSTKTREILWSRPLNYMTRPLIINDTVIIEPRACDLRTGKTKMRRHPVTGKEVPWEFYRPGHTCAATAATEDGLFYRSYSTAFYDLEKDNGLTYFGAIRPGCWINLIPANGLLLFPEASSGCTCSFPLRTSVVLKSKKPETSGQWSVYITHGAMTPVRHLAINLGAPGDRTAANGTLWLGYPRPDVWYGVKFDLQEKLLPDMGYFASDVRRSAIQAPADPWLFVSGCLGFLKCRIPLIDDAWGEKPGIYTVRLGFAAQAGDRTGKRIFDIKLQDDLVLSDFDILESADHVTKAITREFKGINVKNELVLEFVPDKSNPDISRAPILNSIEIIREDQPELAAAPEAVEPLSPDKTGALLKTAKNDLEKNNPEKALALYHRVFDAAPLITLKQKALEGMTAIASPKSLSRIERCCRDTSPILREYKKLSLEIAGSATQLYLAIANKAIDTDTAKAIKMWKHALTIVSELENRQQIVKRLDALGVKIDADAAKAGFITRWQICGKFPWDQEKNTLQKEFINEPDIDLNATYNVADAQQQWHEYVSAKGQIDILELFGSHRRFAIYAYTEIILPDDRELILKIGSDDGFRCWLNGQVVGMYNDGRGFMFDQDVLKIKPKKGLNKLLLKVFNWNGDSAFSVRLTDQEEKPVIGYR